MHYKDLHYTNWDKIAKPTSEKYKAVHLKGDEESEHDLNIFIDLNGNYHFISPAVENSDPLDEIDVNGLDLSIHEYSINDNPRLYIDLRLKNEIYLQQYTIIIKDICENIFEDEFEPVNAINDVLRRWKTFWSAAIREELTEERQLGLFCELKFLAHLIEIEYANPLSRWRGPEGYKHDFFLDDRAIEVKGTLRDGHNHIINGLDQLRRPDDMGLFIVSFLSVRQDEGENLQTMVEHMDTIFVDNPEEYERFYELMITAGYHRSHSEKYRKCCFSIVEENCFEVNDEFPRLTSSYLSRELSSRVSGIRYNVDLNGLPFIALDQFLKD